MFKTFINGKCFIKSVKPQLKCCPQGVIKGNHLTPVFTVHTGWLTAWRSLDGLFQKFFTVFIFYSKKHGWNVNLLPFKVAIVTFESDMYTTCRVFHVKMYCQFSPKVSWAYLHQNVRKQLMERLKLCNVIQVVNTWLYFVLAAYHQWSLLLTWFNLNPRMDE